MTRTAKGVEAPDDKTVVIHLAQALRDAAVLRLLHQFTPIPKAKDTKAELPATPARHRSVHVRQVHPGHRARAGQAQPQLGPGHRPGAPPVPRRLPLQVRRRHRQDADGDPGLQRRRRHEPQLGPDRLLAHPADRRATRRPSSRRARPPACSWSTWTPARSRCRSARPSPSRSRSTRSTRPPAETTHSFSPASTIIPPQVPGHLDYRPRLPGLKMNGTGRRRPGDGQEDAGRRRLRPTSRSSSIYYYTNDDDIAQKVNQVRKQALEAAGFKVTDIGVAGKERRKLIGDPKGKTNMLQSPAWLVLRLAVRRLDHPAHLRHDRAVAGRHDASATCPTPRSTPRSSASSSCRITEQGPEWGKMDKWLTETYLLAIPDNNDKGNSVFGTKVHERPQQPEQGHAGPRRTSGSTSKSAVTALPRGAGSDDSRGGGPGSRAPTTGAHPVWKATRAHVHPQAVALALSVILATLVSTFLLFFAGPSDPARPCARDQRCNARAAGRHHGRASGWTGRSREQFIEYFKGLFVGRDFVYARRHGPVLGALPGLLLRDPPCGQRASSSPASRTPSSLALDGRGRVPDHRRHARHLSPPCDAARGGPQRRRRLAGASASIPYYVLALLVALYPVILWNRPARSTPRYPLRAGRYFGGAARAVDHAGPRHRPPAYTRYTRNSMIETLSMDYIRTARSKGISERTVLFTHGFARRDEPDRHDPRPRHRRAAVRHAHHRADLRGRRHRPARPGGPHATTTCPSSWAPCSSAAVVVVVHEPRRRHRLLLHRPASEALVSTPADRADRSRPQTAEARTAGDVVLEVSDLSVAVPHRGGPGQGRLEPQLPGPPRPHAGHRRRVRLGQVGLAAWRCSACTTPSARRSPAASSSTAWSSSGLAGATFQKVRSSKAAMVFQDPQTSLHPFHTIGNQIAEAYQAHHKVRKQVALKRAVEMLDLVGIPNPRAPRHAATRTSSPAACASAR